MDFKSNPNKPIPGKSEGTYVDEVSRLTEKLKGPIQFARVKQFQSGDVKKLDAERSLMFSEWGMSLRTLYFRIMF
jgi:hypothetical protein